MIFSRIRVRFDMPYRKDVGQQISSLEILIDRAQILPLSVPLMSAI